MVWCGVCVGLLVLVLALALYVIRMLNSNSLLVSHAINAMTEYLATRHSINQAKPKTDLEAKVYEVLSHKNWGASSTIMNEIARDTFDYEKFAVISQLMWEAMENQRPAAWRVVFKGLSLLEHLIKNGSERCVDDARNHGHTLRALHQFNYYEGTIDRGLGVREKSKQLVEILADDERIREERQKAKQLREKFGGNLGGTGSYGGATSSASSASASKYAGYGNDNWNSSSNHAPGGNSGYSGRYGNDASSVDSAPAHTPTPTFAAMPDEDVPGRKTKGKKKKKKDVETSEMAPPEPAVDLFSFDDPVPAPTPAVTAQDDDFGDFASAGGAPGPLAATMTSDPFAAPQPTAQFDAFGGMQHQQQHSFDALGSSQTAQIFQPVSNVNTFRGGMQQQSNVMGGGGMNGYQQHSQQYQQPQLSANDDDFGDFAAATAPTKSVPMGASSSSSDPLSKLISLDGLSKNTARSQEDKLNQPIIANAAAATFVQEKEQIQQSLKTAAKGSAMSFQGIDGLHKSMGNMSMGGGHMSAMVGTAPMMHASNAMGMNPSVMGSGASSAGTIGMLDPSSMGNFTQAQQFQQGGGGGGGLMSSQMMGSGGGAMGMGMMNPNMQHQLGVINPQMMLGGAYSGGGAGGMNSSSNNNMNMGGMQQQFGNVQGGGTNNQHFQQSNGMGYSGSGMPFQQQGGFR